MKKNKTIVEKVRFPKVNWSKVLNVVGVVFIISIVFILPWVIINSQYDTTAEQVSTVKVGMTKQEVFDALGEEGWSNYDEDGFDYGYNFKSPGGGKKTFWVTIKNDVVTDIATY